MRVRIAGRLLRRWCWLAWLIGPLVSGGQQVRYSPFLEDRQEARFEFLGRSGAYYWVQKTRAQHEVPLPAPPWRSDARPVFEIFNQAMSPVAEVPSLPLADTLLKEYWVCGDHRFDLLVLAAAGDSTRVLLRSYLPDGTLQSDGAPLVSFPFRESGNNFLLARSANRERQLLLAFQAVTDSAPRLYALLFDQDWNLLSRAVYRNPLITQPYVQYEFFSGPLEAFDNSPLKLAGDGRWAMLTPGRRNRNYLLLRFTPGDTALAWQPIRLSPSEAVEQVTLSLDEDHREWMTGILSRYRYAAVKSVDVARCSLDRDTILFDSAYRFNTLRAAQVRNQNLVEEDFLPVPGRGFLLLKEYGKDYASVFTDRESRDTLPDTTLLYQNRIISADPVPPGVRLDRNEYTRFTSLAGPRNRYQRGDLSVFYFPAGPEDSSWSGLINQEQTTEMNSARLSYLAVPLGGRTFFLYNRSLRSNQAFASTTVLDSLGHELEQEGIVFWNLRNTLAFQQARWIAPNEVAVPYSSLRRAGFAVIRF
ncbi:MAG TPA: hypothetical protein VG870_13840 [Chitinophagaceae bacterium]|nr:hypothetical protein [Chitinophagaceae bacterium]